MHESYAVVSTMFTYITAAIFVCTIASITVEKVRGRLVQRRMSRIRGGNPKIDITDALRRTS